MTPEISERKFEDDIERALLAGGLDTAAGDASVVAEPSPGYGEAVPGGYHKRDWTTDYDRQRCLIGRDVLDFIYATSPRSGRSTRSSTAERPRRSFSSGSRANLSGGARSTCCAAG